MKKEELDYIKENFFKEKIDIGLIMEMIGQTVDEASEDQTEPTSANFSAARFYKRNNTSRED